MARAGVPRRVRAAAALRVGLVLVMAGVLADALIALGVVVATLGTMALLVAAYPSWGA